MYMKTKRGTFLSCYNLIHYNLLCTLMKVFKAACSANRSRYTENVLVLYYCCRYVALSGFFSSTLFLACFPGLPITLCNCCGALWVGKGNRLHYFRIISRFLGFCLFVFFGGWVLCKCVCLLFLLTHLSMLSYEIL